MKKRIIALLASLAGVMAVGTTTAYFISSDDKENSLTAGENIITVNETFTSPTLNQGENTYEKDVKISNAGSVPCYIRVYVGFSSLEAEEASMLSSDGGTTWYSFEDYKNHLPAGWVYNNSGNELGKYFYYTQPLTPGSETASLFTTVRTNVSEGGLGNFDIIVYAESVQNLDKNGEEFSGTSGYLNAWTEFLSE